MCFDGIKCKNFLLPFNLPKIDVEKKLIVTVQNLFPFQI